MKIIYPLLSILFIAKPFDLLSDMDQIVRSEFALESAFTREGHDAQGDPAHGSFGVSIYGRRQDHATLDIDVWKVPTNKVTRFWADKMGSLGSAGPDLPFSGLPLGAATGTDSGDSSAALSTYDGTFFVSAMINLNRRAQDREADKVACEGVVRRTLARLRGLDAQQRSNIIIGSVSVPAFTGACGDVLVDLQVYCQARNFALNVSARGGTASFQSGTRLVIVALAARKVKGGSQWYDSQDISIIRNGRWFVALNALNSASGI